MFISYLYTANQRYSVYERFQNYPHASMDIEVYDGCVQFLDAHLKIPLIHRALKWSQTAKFTPNLNITISCPGDVHVNDDLVPASRISRLISAVWVWFVCITPRVGINKMRHLSFYP